MTDNFRTTSLIIITAIVSALVVVIGIVLMIMASKPVRAQSFWDRPVIRACCSDADAVWADDWRVNPDGSVSAVVTGGGPRGHAWAPMGRRYEVPRDKIRDREGNPTGRPLLFINPGNLDHVYCFVPGALT